MCSEHHMRWSQRSHKYTITLPATLLPPWRGRRGGRSAARGAGGGLSGSWGPYATGTRTERRTTPALARLFGGGNTAD